MKALKQMGEANDSQKCMYLDSEIDRVIYELYGLTEEKIIIVEEE